VYTPYPDNNLPQDSWVGGRVQGGPPLAALAGDPATMPPGRWSSIRTGDILGDRNMQVLALDGTQLQAWEYYVPSSGIPGWNHVSPSVPLKLGGPMWDNDASYYSTLQVGDVTGDGRAAVIARGPFGIRTWFYDLHGNSGWTGWLPQGTASYPQYSGAEAAAWTELNALAHSRGLIAPDQSSVRAAWTATNPPSATQLSTLNDGIVLVGDCSGETSVTPPTYASCTPPTGSSGFTAADWTAVGNDTLADVYAARQVLV